MLRLLKAVRPDVVQVTAGWPTQVWPCAWSCALCGIPLLAVFQLAPEKETLPWVRLKLLLWARRRRQRWMAVSQQNLLPLQQTFGTGPNEIGVLYNGIEIDPNTDVPNDAETQTLRQEVRTELGVHSDVKLLLTTARLNGQKGHVDLLQIVPRIIDEFPDVIFVWAGDGPQRRPLEAQVRRQNLQRHVRLLGYRDDISACFARPISLYFHHTSRVDAQGRYAKQWCTDFQSSAPMLAAFRKFCTTALMHSCLRFTILMACLRNCAWRLNYPANMNLLADQARQRITEFSSKRMVADYFAILKELSRAERHVR